MKKSLLTAALVAAAISTSPAEAKKPPVLTPMELQALQSREYQTSKDQVFSSVVSVFQDLGYQISAADIASGFITAGSANKNKTGFFEALGGISSSGASRVTAFIETMPSGLTRARLNFMNTKNSSSLYGSSSAKDTPVLEPKTYQVAFEHIEEALFERGALTKTAAPAQAAVQAAVLTPSVTAAAVATTSAPANTSAAAASANAPGPAAAAAPRDAKPVPAAATPPK
jgi:hypothetical protein